jgi:trehalose 6-phosphate phosphatase
LFTFLPVPGLTLIGTHGLEIRAPDGNVSQMLPTGAFMLAMARMQREVRQLIRGKEGFVLEDKRQALALHYRLADPQEAAQIVSRVQTMLRRYQQNGVALELLYGKKVAEIRPVGVNKGKAVSTLLQQVGTTVFPIYVGDDTTDEDAFRILADRGLNILVGAVSRPTSAHYYVEDPREVYELLEHVLACLIHTLDKNSLAQQSPPLQPNDEAFAPCHPVRAQGT